MRSFIFVCVLLTSSSALATSPCPVSTTQPCRNNWGSAVIYMGLGVDSLIGTLITSSANASYVARGRRPGVTWLVLGIHYAAYSGILGTFMMAEELSTRARFPQWQGDSFQLGMGVALAASSVINATLAAVAYSQPPKKARAHVAPWLTSLQGDQRVGLAVTIVHE